MVAYAAYSMVTKGGIGYQWGSTRVRYQPRKSALTLNLPHVTICLLGKFKGETGVDHYLIKAIVVRLERPGYLVPLQRRKYKAPVSKIVKLLQLIVYM